MIRLRVQVNMPKARLELLHQVVTCGSAPGYGFLIEFRASDFRYVGRLINSVVGRIRHIRNEFDERSGFFPPFFLRQMSLIRTCGGWDVYGIPRSGARYFQIDLPSCCKSGVY